MNPCITFGGNGMNTIEGATSGTSLTQIVAGTASKHIWICSILLTGGTGTTPTFELESGTGTNCASSTTPLLNTAAANALCYVVGGSSTPTATYLISYVQQ
jgi:hypothetical protein